MNIAEILYVNPRTRSALVLDEVNNKIIEVPLVPLCRDEDVEMNTWEDLPKEGTKVYLNNLNGTYFISGTQVRKNFEKSFDDYRTQRSLLGINASDPLLYGVSVDSLNLVDGYAPSGGETVGGKDPLYRNSSVTEFDYSGSSYDDLLPGDKVMATKDGNSIAILEGGVNVFKASELCQIVGIKYNDLMRVVSRNFQHFTDFGNIEVKNDQGRVSYILDGASSQAASRAGKFGLRIEMGDAGGIYKVSVLNGSGRPLASFHMKTNGDVVRMGQNVFEQVLKDMREEVQGKKTSFLGGRETLVKGDSTETIRGNDIRTVVNNQVTSAQNDMTHMIARNYTRMIGGVKSETIQGGILSGEAISRDIFVGSKRETITTTGDFKQNVLGAGGFYRTTTAGNVEESTLAGTLKRTTQAGNIEDSVTVGQYKLTVTTGTAKLEAGIGGINGSVEITSTSVKVKEGIGATLHLSNGKVALGFAANELLNLIDLIIAELNKTEVGIANHIHGSVMGPTTPPTNASLFMNANSALMAIKSRLLSITGSL